MWKICSQCILHSCCTYHQFFSGNIIMINNNPFVSLCGLRMFIVQYFSSMYQWRYWSVPLLRSSSSNLSIYPPTLKQYILDKYSIYTKITNSINVRRVWHTLIEAKLWFVFHTHAHIEYAICCVTLDRTILIDIRI